jgi:hypothetical protein
VIELLGFCVVSYYAYQARQANRLMRQSIEASQRPILSVRVTGHTLVVGQIPTMNFEIDNLGRIPALNVRLKACGDIAHIPADNFVLPDCATPTHAPSVIFPGYPQQEHARTHQLLSPTEDDSVKNNASAFYLMGLILYTDAQRVDYFTRFCFRYPGASESEVLSCPNPNANDAD